MNSCVNSDDGLIFKTKISVNEMNSYKMHDHVAAEVAMLAGGMGLSAVL